jgi:hypothetical protein
MNSYEKLKLLVLEDPDVAPVILDLLESFKDKGFEHWIEPIVAEDLVQACEKLAQADMALIDIGRSEEHKNFAIAVLGECGMPIILTSALPQHKSIKDNAMVGFISKPKYSLEKITRDLTRLGRIALNKKALSKERILII